MTKLKTATARMSQPKVRSFRGPCRPSSGIELGVLVSNELRYEIAPMPSRYGQSQTALCQSSDRFRAVESVAFDTASRANPTRIATISFHITAQPVKSKISLAATNAPGASSEAAGSLKGRGRAGSCRLSAPSASGAIAYTATAAAEIKPTSCCQPGKGRRITNPQTNENAIAKNGVPRGVRRAKADGMKPLRASAKVRRALAPV